MLKKLFNRHPFRIPYFIGLLFPALIFSSAVNAQTVVVENNANISAAISAKELTRISVAGDRLTLIRGSEGAYQISNDAIQGAVFIKPIVDQPAIRKVCPLKKNKGNKKIKVNCQKIKEKKQVHHLKSFYLFVSTEQGRHYVLNLTPRFAQHADSLVLTPQELEQEAAKTWETSERYTQTLILLVEGVLQQRMPTGYVHTVLKKPKEFTFGKQFNLRLTDQYTGANLSVEVYQLINHSHQTETLSEEDLYQPNDRAIYLQEKNLAPHQTTQLIKVTSHV